VKGDASGGRVRTAPTDDARRENSPPGGVITLSKSLLHIRQQNYEVPQKRKINIPTYHVFSHKVITTFFRRNNQP